MTVDHDGKIRMDCSSSYAMPCLVSLKNEGNWRWRSMQQMLSGPAFEWLRVLTASLNRSAEPRIMQSVGRVETAS